MRDIESRKQNSLLCIWFALNVRHGHTVLLKNLEHIPQSTNAVIDAEHNAGEVIFTGDHGFSSVWGTTTEACLC